VIDVEKEKESSSCKEPLLCETILNNIEPEKPVKHLLQDMPALKK
jgi:hypothetical protein